MHGCFTGSIREAGKKLQTYGFPSPYMHKKYLVTLSRKDFKDGFNT